MDSCSLLASLSNVVHDITKQLDEALFAKKEVAIKNL